jgi:hypothetical protein
MILNTLYEDNNNNNNNNNNNCIAKNNNKTLTFSLSSPSRPTRGVTVYLYSAPMEGEWLLHASAALH